MKKYILATVTLLLFSVLLVGEPALALPNNGIVNTWALGIDEATGPPGDIESGWTHSDVITLSRCCKNPSPTGGNGGSAFKNGGFNGGGISGVEGISSQEFTVDYAATHTFSFSSLIVCVRCDYLIAELYGDDILLGTLLSFSEGAQSCGVWGWQRYCGDEITVPHATTYRLEIRTRWTSSPDWGAVKWTGLNLVIDGGLPTATPTPTETAVPGATATPTPFPFTPTGTPEIMPTATCVWFYNHCN